MFTEISYLPAKNLCLQATSQCNEYTLSEIFNTHRQLLQRLMEQVATVKYQLPRLFPEVQ